MSLRNTNWQWPSFLKYLSKYVSKYICRRLPRLLYEEKNNNYCRSEIAQREVDSRKMLRTFKSVLNEFMFTQLTTLLPFQRQHTKHITHKRLFSMWQPISWIGKIRQIYFTCKNEQQVYKKHDKKYTISTSRRSWSVYRCVATVRCSVQIYVDYRQMEWCDHWESREVHHLCSE